MDGSYRGVWLDFVRAGGVRGASLALRFVVAILVARSLGAEGFGLYSFGVGVGAIAGAVLGCGNEFVVVREVARRWEGGRKEDVRDVIRHALAWSVVIVAGGGLSLLGLLGAGAWDGSWGGGKVLAGVLGISVGVGLALNLLAKATLEGAGHVHAANAVEGIVWPVLFAGLVGLSVLYFGGLGYPVAVVGNGVTGILAAGVAWWLVGRVADRGWESGELFVRREFLLAGIPFLLVTSVNVVSQQVGVVVGGFWLTGEEIGELRAASQIGEMVAIGLAVASMFVRPRIAGLHAAGERDKLQRFVSECTGWVSVMGLTVFSGVVAGREVLLGLFGDGFVGAGKALVVIAAGQLVNCLCGPCGFVLSMTDHAGKQVRIMGASLVVNVVLCIALVPWAGVMGAAVASSVSLVVWNVWMVRVARRKVGVDPSVLQFMKTKW